MTQNPLQVLPHPFTEGGCLLAVGVGSPSLMLMELVAKMEPQVVHKAAMPDHMPLLGLGLLQVCAVVHGIGAGGCSSELLCLADQPGGDIIHTASALCVQGNS